MAKNEKLNKFRNQLKGTIKRIDHPQISDRAEVVEKDKEYHIFYIPGNFSTFFEELDILGEGCVGLVKKVKKISTQEYFACKMVKLKDEETVLQVIREFKNIKKLNHPNIVRVYELYVDEIKRRIYTIMELVEAREMFEVIRKLGSYSEQIASRIFKQVLSCIKYMHEECVCHRDLKPNNILATEDGQCVKITDFNISKFGSTSKKEQFHNKNIKMWTYTGTVSFSAPEVFSEDEYDQSVDIWSAGVVLYTMLSGQEPFQAEYLQDLIAQIQNAQYQFQSEIWASISDEAKDLIQKCLILNPKERITPDQALLHPWITGKQNTSPLALIIFNNFENNARRLSKKLIAYQNLGLMKPVNRKISIDCSILQRSSNMFKESDYSGDSPYLQGLAQLSRSRQHSGGSASKCSNQSQGKNLSQFADACYRSDTGNNSYNNGSRCESPQIMSSGCCSNFPLELTKISSVQSPPNTPPLESNKACNNELTSIQEIPFLDADQNSQQFDENSNNNNFVYRNQKSHTFSESLQSQNNPCISNKLIRNYSLQTDKEIDNNKNNNINNNNNAVISIDNSPNNKNEMSCGTPCSSQNVANSQFSRFTRSQKSHKTLILHDRYKLNEEEQFLLSQNQFSEQNIDPSYTSIYPFPSSTLNNSGNHTNSSNNNNNACTNSLYRQNDANQNNYINPSLVFLGDNFCQQEENAFGISSKIIPSEPARIDQNRKKGRHLTLNEQQKRYHFPK